MKYIPYFSYVLVIILVILLVRSCGEQSRVNGNLEVLGSLVETYELKNGQLVTEKGVLEVSVKDLKNEIYVKDDSLQLLIKKFKDPQVVYKIKTKIVLDTMEVIYKVPVPFEFERDLLLFDPYYTLTGKSNNLGVTITSLSIPNTQRIVTGVKKGLFRTELSTSVTNSNPYIQTTDIITQKQYVPIRRLGVGVFGGIDITGEPTIGVGVSWHLIEF